MPWPAPGEWLEVGPGDRRACAARIHACRAQDLVEWMDAELWRIELDGDVRVDCGKLIAERGRLVERVAAWDAAFIAAFAEACTLRARDAALLLLTPGDPAHAALAAAASAAQIAAVAADGTLLGALDPRRGACAGIRRRRRAPCARRSRAAGHRADPRRRQRLHRAHAAAFAQDDLGAVERERAWQTAWLAEHAGL